MAALFEALVWGHLRANALRAATTVVAVALGVAIALAIDLANATAVDSFAHSVNVVSSGVNLQVLGVDRGFDERALLRVRAIAGVRSASPVIEDALTVGMRPGERRSGEVLNVLGVDMLRPLPGLDGTHASGAGPNGPDPWTVVNGYGAFLSARVVAAEHLRVGQRFTALAGDRQVRLVLAGLIPKGTVGVDSSVAFVDVVTAQEIFGKVGLIDRIDCAVDPARLATTAAAIRRVVPPGARVIEPRTRTGEIGRMLRSFQLNLAALAYVALLVGMYLIYNTVAISVVARRPEIGALRAIGARRDQILRVFLAEGTMFGVVGSLLGLVLGALLARYSVAAVSRTVNTLYVTTHADRVVYDPATIVHVFLLGVAAAIVSAIVPAFDAAGTPPALTMRAYGFERRFPRLAASAAAGGVVLLAIGYVCSLAPPVHDVPVFGYAAGLAFIFAGSSFAPPAIIALARATRRLFADRSALSELAAANLASAPIRTSVAVAALMIAIAMMVAVAILIGSFRTTVVAWADETLRADLFVSAPGSADASYDARLAPETVARIAALPGVAEVDTFRGITFPLDGRLTTLGSTELGTAVVRRALRFIGPVDRTALVRRLPGSTGVLISEPFATKFGLGVGDRFPIDTPSGRASLQVAAVYNDYSSDAGIALIDRRTFVRLFHDDTVNSIAVYARPGTDLAVLRTAIVRSVLPLQVEVQTNRELRALVLAIFNRTFAITYALYVISIAIAVLGVVTTLFALVLERRREIGILRYLGLRAGDVRRMVLVEAGFIGLLGGLLGVAVGVVLALLLIFVINRQAFGWLIELHVPYPFLAQAIVLVVIAALVAGIYPARIASRIRTADAVRSE